MAEWACKELARGFTYPESPRWHEDALWFTDIPEHRVMRWTEGVGCEAVVDLGELATSYGWERAQLGPSGLDFLPDGTALIAMMSERGPLRTGLLAYSDGNVSSYADVASVVSGRLNDMVVSDDGDVYVGALDAAAIVHVSPSGDVSVALPNIPSPNGMAISPDNSELLFVTGGTSIYAASILAGGRLGRPRLWADLTVEAVMRRHLVQGDRDAPVRWADFDGVSGADGVALDTDGALWVAGVSTEKFIRITFGGYVTDVIRTPGRHAIACHLGGPNRRRLFLATAALREGSVRTGGVGSPQLLEQLQARETVGYLEAVDVPVGGAGRP